MGNVLVTIIDKRLPVLNSSGNLSYYEADVVTATNYYPFGMQMPGRKYDAGSGYRYGFNGKENDNEVKGEGNQQDYGMRIYDPRLGRFLRVDPITADYPELTPYQFASNTPIAAIDIDGLEGIIPTYGMEHAFPALAKYTAEQTARYNQNLKIKAKSEAAGAVAGATFYVGVFAFSHLVRGVLGLGGWASRPENQQLFATVGTFAAGMLDPNPAGAPSADLPGVGDDAGRVVKRLFTSISPIIEKRKELAKSWGIAVKFIEYSKRVFTKNLKEGTELIQYRVLGSEGTIGNYFALPNTKPEAIGIKADDVIETLTVRVRFATKALFSSHKKDLPYYKDGATILEGGGVQIFSKELKNNVEVIDKKVSGGTN